MVTALLILAVLVLIALNAFFVMAEFALVRARRSKIDQMAEEGQAGAKAAQRQIADMTHYLSSAQLGITLASIAIGFLGEPVVAGLVEPLFGALPKSVGVVISILIAYAIVTALHIVLGEQVPKVLSIVRAEATLRRTAPPLAIFTKVLQPFIWLMRHVSNGVLRLFGVKADAELAEMGTGVDELELMITELSSGGKLDIGEAGMLAGVLQLHEQDARQVMTPITNVVMINESETIESALRRCVSSGHSRLLITEGDDRDRILGFVHVTALARKLLDAGPEKPVGPLAMTAQVVPETKPLDDLLAELQHQRSSISVVVDEYGRTSGIVTIEDIVEEIVGEIDDETDPARGHDVRRLPNGDWFIRGHVPVADLEDEGIELPQDSDSYTTIGGLVFHELGRLPRRGDTVDSAGYALRVEAVRDKRIESVRVRPQLDQPAAEASDSE